MKFISVLFFGILATLTNCSQPKQELSNNKEIIGGKSLLENVKLAINPRFQDWVLFEHGTYIIFDNADTISDIRSEAIKLIREFGPVGAGGPAGDFSVTDLRQTAGWVVSGHGYGMYTYVNPKEFKHSSPSDVEIGLHGRSKRDKDGENPKIIHINRKQ